MSRRFAPLVLACLCAGSALSPVRAQDDTRGEAPPAVDPDAAALTDEGDEIIERRPSAEAGAGLGLEGIPERAGDERRFTGRVRTEFAEVMAGPGSAYIGRGRIYQNDRVQILRRNEGGDWLEVELEGLRGWVRSRYLEIQRATEVRGADGVVDAGRDRRRTNYAYDARGRRLRPDGTPFGSGEGAGDDADSPPGASADDGFDAAPARSATSPRGGFGLAPSLALGLGQVRRAFDSDIEKPSPLAHQTAQPMGLSLTVGVDWDPMRYLRLGGRFDGVFFGSTDIPQNPALGFAKPVTLEISGWRAGLDALGRYPFGPAWAGLYGGLRLFRQNFQETAAYPLFLTNTLWSAVAGGAAGATFGPGVEVSARGGYCLPLSLAQSPADSGALQSGSGYELGLQAAWPFHRRVSAVLDVYFTRHRFEFAGASSQKQTFDVAQTPGKEPVGYEHARETDTLQGLGLGVRGSL